MEKFNVSGIFGLIMWGLVWLFFNNNPDSVIIGLIVGSVVMGIIWLLLNLYDLQKRFQYLVNPAIIEAKSISAKQYINGQFGVIAISMLLGSLLIQGGYLLTTWLIPPIHHLYLTILAGYPILIFMVVFITYQQYSLELFGAYAVRFSLKVGFYLMVCVAGIGTTIGVFSKISTLRKTSLFLDIGLLLLISLFSTIIIGFAHAICWDNLGFYPPKHQHKFTPLGRIQACEQHRVPFGVQVQFFWHGIFTGLFTGFLPFFVYMATVVSTPYFWDRLLIGIALYIGYMVVFTVHYNSTVEQTPIRVLTSTFHKSSHNEACWIIDVSTKKRYRLSKEDHSYIRWNQAYDIWVFKPFMQGHVLAIKGPATSYQPSQPQQSRRMSLAGLSNRSFRSISSLKLSERIKRYESDIIREVSQKNTKRVHQLRNALGRCHEKLGNVTEAIVLYEQNVLEHCPYIHPYERLRILYTRQKRYQEAYRICQVYIGLPWHSRRILKSMTYHAHKLEKRLKTEPKMGFANPPKTGYD